MGLCRLSLLPPTLQVVRGRYEGLNHISNQATFGSFALANNRAGPGLLGRTCARGPLRLFTSFVELLHVKPVSQLFHFPLLLPSLPWVLPCIAFLRELPPLLQTVLEPVIADDESLDVTSCLDCICSLLPGILASDDVRDAFANMWGVATAVGFDPFLELRDFLWEGAGHGDREMLENGHDVMGTRSPRGRQSRVWFEWFE